MLAPLILLQFPVKAGASLFPSSEYPLTVYNPDYLGTHPALLEFLMV